MKIVVALILVLSLSVTSAQTTQNFLEKFLDNKYTQQALEEFNRQFNLQSSTQSQSPKGQKEYVPFKDIDMEKFWNMMEMDDEQLRNQFTEEELEEFYHYKTEWIQIKMNRIQKKHSELSDFDFQKWHDLHMDSDEFWGDLREIFKIYVNRGESTFIEMWLNPSFREMVHKVDDRIYQEMVQFIIEESQ